MKTKKIFFAIIFCISCGITNNNGNQSSITKLYITMQGTDEVAIYSTPDLTLLKKACEIVGKYIKKNSIFILESTVYPGCTEKFCVPILERVSKLKFNKDFYCGYSPERINPGDSVHNFKNIVKITKEKGLNVINDYFDLNTSKEIMQKYGKADIIVGNAVFAHVDNLDEIILAVKNTLEDNGVFIFEINYLGDMIDELQYDVIYHEHTMYHSVLTLKKFLEKKKV